MRVRIRGTVYASVEHAAEVLGVAKTTIYTALKRDRLDLVGLGPGRSAAARATYGGRGGNIPKPTTVGGKHFPTQRALAEWLGICPKHLSLMKSQGQVDRILSLVMQRTAREDAAARKALDSKMNAGIPRESWKS